MMKQHFFPKQNVLLKKLVCVLLILLPILVLPPSFLPSCILLSLITTSAFTETKSLFILYFFKYHFIVKLADAPL